MIRESLSEACATAVFPRLADPARYVACRWDLTKDAAKRAYWLDLFARHWPSLLKHARQEAADRSIAHDDVERRIARADSDFRAWLEAAGRQPDCFGRLDILMICEARQAAIDAVGLYDPYRLAKSRENALAMKLLPARLRELDAMAPPTRARDVIEGVFAGNIFDLGATSTNAMFEQGPVDFHAVRAKLRPRPWFDDDLDAWLAAVSDPARYRRAVLFVDNAGPDVLLGMLPLARYLLQRGSRVLLTANTGPALNDVTHDELVDLVRQVGAWDGMTAAALADGRLTLMPSGNNQPLIDLSRVSPELADAVESRGESRDESRGENRGCDLVVLEGMGRAVESNYDARFDCDCLKLAMIKDEGVASAMGAEVFDLVCRFEPAG